MRIGIDGRPLQTVSRYRGIGSYAYHLIENLLSADTRNDYVVFGFRGRDFPLLEGRTVEFRPVLKELGIDRRWLWESFFMNRILSRFDLDLFHVTQPCCITGIAPYRVVVTVHDIIPIALGGKCVETSRPDRKIGYGRQLRTIQRADRVITYSQATAADLVEILRVPRDTIVVTPIGCDDSFQPSNDTSLVERCRAEYGTGERYILFVGGLEERKNLSRVVSVLPEVRNRSGDIHLVIVSEMPEGDCRKIRSLARGLHVERCVHLLGHIPLRDLVAVMNGAVMLALPSFYEGFGLPVLEAMACGTPVITSNTSSLPEVAGDAALLVDPSGDAAIRDGIIRILSDEGLRNEMREKGLERAGLFSWRRHAEDMLAVYGEVAGGVRASGEEGAGR